MSQSLLHQGSSVTRSGRRSRPPTAAGLNPFFIREVLSPTTPFLSPGETSVSQSLLHQGSSVTSKTCFTPKFGSACLNPFFIREVLSLPPEGGMRIHRTECLNPFFIREVLSHAGGGRASAGGDYVSIPSSSGKFCHRKEEGIMRRFLLVSQSLLHQGSSVTMLRRMLEWMFSVCLNPFFIREVLSRL